jgi:hypothetical protein
MANAQSWSLGTVEVGTSLGSGTGTNMKVHIGKILPLIPLAKPKSKQVALSNSCFVNDSECKPQCASQVKTVNYITVPTNGRIDASKVTYGTELRIEVRNNSVDQLTVTNTV